LFYSSGISNHLTCDGADAWHESIIRHEFQNFARTGVVELDGLLLVCSRLNGVMSTTLTVFFDRRVNVLLRRNLDDQRGFAVPSMAGLPSG